MCKDRTSQTGEAIAIDVTSLDPSTVEIIELIEEKMPDLAAQLKNNNTACLRIGVFMLRETVMESVSITLCQVYGYHSVTWHRECQTDRGWCIHLKTLDA